MRTKNYKLGFCDQRVFPAPCPILLIYIKEIYICDCIGEMQEKKTWISCRFWLHFLFLFFFLIIFFFFLLQMIVQTFVSHRMTAIIVYKVVVYLLPVPFLIPIPVHPTKFLCSRERMNPSIPTLKTKWMNRLNPQSIMFSLFLLIELPPPVPRFNFCCGPPLFWIPFL